MTIFEQSASLERLDVLYDYIKRVRDDLKKITGIDNNNQLEIYQDLHKAMIYVEDATNRLRFVGTEERAEAGVSIPKREHFVCKLCGRECERHELVIEHLVDNAWCGVCHRCSRIHPDKVSNGKVLSDAEKERMMDLVRKIGVRR